MYGWPRGGGGRWGGDGVAGSPRSVSAIPFSHEALMWVLTAPISDSKDHSFFLNVFLFGFSIILHPGPVFLLRKV